VSRLLAERITHERELRIAAEKAFDHERELRTVYDRHERELRVQTEQAVEKARELQFNVYEARLENLNHAAERMERLSQTFLTIDRYEREHVGLTTRLDAYQAETQARLGKEEQVTVRQDTAKELLEVGNTNRRWLVGISIGLIFSLIGVLITLFSLLEHQGSI
jgi:hypothetical protein